MTKARDIASAIPAPATVSSVELGYLDGVTSAIQTQVDSKIGSASAINPTIVDAKGDLIGGTADNAFARLTVGANNTVLTADNTTATGLKWAAAAAGGKVLQVVSAKTNTIATNSTNVYENTGLTATITPTLNTSKILVILSQNGLNKTNGNSGNSLNLQLLRGVTVLDIIADENLWNNLAQHQIGTSISFEILDAPATTSATTYKTQFMNFNNTASCSVQAESGVSSIILMEIGA